MVFLLSASFMNRWYKKSNSGPDAGSPNSESRRARAWRPESLLTLIGRTPAPNQMLCGAFPLRELKLETSFDKTTGDNAAALEHQFRFGAQKTGTYLQHPACSRQPDA